MTRIAVGAAWRGVAWRGVVRRRMSLSSDAKVPPATENVSTAPPLLPSLFFHYILFDVK